jgi:cytochrome c
MDMKWIAAKLGRRSAANASLLRLRRFTLLLMHQSPILRLLLTGALALLAAFTARAAEGFDPARLEREVLAAGLHDPLQMDALPNGDALIAEMHGTLKRWRAATRDVIEVGRVPVTVSVELGLIGVAAAGDFAQSGNVFLFFCPAAKRDSLRLARFTIGADGRLDLGSEKVLLEYPIEFNGAIHMGGGLFFDKAKGHLILGTGDNAPPFHGAAVDVSPGGLMRDALRSSGNSQDLRGKILRIRPRADGGYDIPPGNLFTDPAQGRPEIFAMGVRNGFHASVDPKTGWIAWGDVGPNTNAATGSVGYDEFNLATKAGNFGHPMFTGPNEPYRSLGADGKPGELFDAARPLNHSPRNTGVKELPPALPALLWYPTTASKEFPDLGSGARSAMAGPFHHFDAAVKSDLKLPQHFDGALFIYEWTRNWIKVVRLTAEGKLAGIEPFASQFVFRKPMDIKFAPDHTMFVLEYGDKWHGNTDGQLLRLSYRRGNRPPVAALAASPLAGKQPLEVRFDAGASRDADGDALKFAWDFGGGKTSSETAPRWTFTEPGQHTVALKVTDAAGAVSETRTVITVGNAAPLVEILDPPNGGFFDAGQPVSFQVRVTDAEDGNLAPERVTVQGAYRAARSGDAVHPGLAMMQRTTCFACHTVREKSAGPSYLEIARKYQNDAPAREKLAAKIIAGGGGVWGQLIAMPPHPQHTLGETQLMADWILGLARSPEAAAVTGLTGTLKTTAGGERQDGGVFVITAACQDNGAAGLPPLRGSAEHILHARKRKAALHDASQGVEVVDFMEGGHGLVARLTHGGWLKFSRVNLTGIESLTLRLHPFAAVALEVRAGSPQGPLVAQTGPLDAAGGFREVTIPVSDPGGVNDLVFLARTEPAQKGSVLDLNWVHFVKKKTPAAAGP